MINITNKPAKHYSPLRYPGGKSCLAKYFGKLINDNEIEDCIYVEPYAGGSGAALQLLILEEVDRIIINDLDRSIYAFWWSILKKTDQFIDKITSIKVNMKEWNKQKDIISNNRSSLFNRGFAAFYLNRTNRSGILEGGPIGGKHQSGKWKIDARFNKTTLINRIETIRRYTKRIDLYNLDGIELLKKIHKKKNIFVYLDPPYFAKGSQLYLNYYNFEDHKKLSQFLNKHTKFNWILTYDKIEEIRKLYKKRKTKSFGLNYSAENHKRGKELIIYSDNLN